MKGFFSCHRLLAPRFLKTSSFFLATAAVTSYNSYSNDDDNNNSFIRPKLIDSILSKFSPDHLFDLTDIPVCNLAQDNKGEEKDLVVKYTRENLYYDTINDHLNQITMHFFGGNSTLAIITAINLGVFAMWRFRRLEPFLMKHFTLSLQNLREYRFHTILTCAFSHSGFFHLAFNMIALQSFARAVFYQCQWDDAEFLKIYLGSGLAGSLAVILHSLVVRSRAGTITLGASACVYGLFMHASYLPHAKMGIIFLPFEFESHTFANAVLCFEILALLFWRSSPMSHAGHLGGALFGMGIYRYNQWARSSGNKRPPPPISRRFPPASFSSRSSSVTI